MPEDAQTLLSVHPEVQPLAGGGPVFDIPLNDGRFACGRVMVVEVQGRRSFVVGLMDWTGADVPTSDDLAERGVLNQPITNIDAIGNNGGSIRGQRPLDWDGIAAVDHSRWSRRREVIGLGLGHREEPRRGGIFRRIAAP